ncbi:Bro-N domain-containing protein [Neglectibacter sp. X4]|uniref:BRO-N domain-containing protein n=1 Tax=unclassified Neglectibacter TaxID=2632164 RepID=UPI00352C5B36
MRNHVDDEDKLTRNFNGSGQNRAMTVINESGVYALIFGSKLDSAKRFKHWVTHEVLPSIRKTGSYTLPGYASLPQVISIVAETKKRMKAEGKENWEIAHACYEIGENYGVTLPKFFAEDCKMPDEEAVAMVDFACEHPEYQQNPDAGYYAFVLSQCTVRQLRGRKPKKLES